jgi:signal transduction histidine kinase
MLRSGEVSTSTRRSFRSLPPSRIAHALQAIERHAQTQARLVEPLLDLSRVMAGKLELDLQPIDAFKVLDAAVDIVRPDADANTSLLNLSAASAASTSADRSGRGPLSSRRTAGRSCPPGRGPRGDRLAAVCRTVIGLAPQVLRRSQHLGEGHAIVIFDELVEELFASFDDRWLRRRW